MDTDNLNNEINQNQLLPTDEIIKLAKEGGVKFGFGDPSNRIRYLVKNGLLPHQVRKVIDGKIIPHLPYLSLAKLIEIQKLQNTFKYTIPQLVNHFNDTEVKTERAKYEEPVAVAIVPQGNDILKGPEIPAVVPAAVTIPALKTEIGKDAQNVLVQVPPSKTAGAFSNVISNNDASKYDILDTSLNTEATNQVSDTGKAKKRVARYVIAAILLLLLLLGVTLPIVGNRTGLSLGWLTSGLNDTLGFFKNALNGEEGGINGLGGLSGNNSSLTNISSQTPTDGTTTVFGINIPAVFSDTVTFEAPVNFLSDVNMINQNLNLGSGSLTAANVIYSIIAGQGIQVSAGQNPIITNTGVLSLGGQTGNVELQAGEGISIDGTQITNTGVTSIGGETGDVEFVGGRDIDVDGNEINLQSVIDTVTQINLPADSENALRFDGIGLGAPGSSPTTSGASLVGFYDNIDNSNADNLQLVITDIDAAIGDRVYTAPNFVTSGQSLTDSIQALDGAVSGQTVWVDGGNYVYTLNGEVLGNPASGGANKMNGLYLDDGSPLSFGSNNNFIAAYDGTQFALTDGANIFVSVIDNGASADFAVNRDDLFVASTGRVGIGTTAPVNALDVIGNASITGQLTIGTIPPVGATTSVLVSDAGVVSNIDVTTWDRDTGDDITNFLDLTDTPNSYAGNANFFVRVNPGATALQFADLSAWDQNESDDVTAAGVARFIPLYASTSDLITSILYQENVTNNVGIGTTAPLQALDVVGGIRTSNDFYVGDIGLGFTSPLSAGSYLVGTYDEFTHSDSTNVQDVLDDLDAAISVSGHDPVTLAGAFDYLTLIGQEITLHAIDLATDVSGFLATANGGLGANVTAAGAGEVLYSTGATTYDSLPAGSSNQLLISGGAGAPSWSNITSLVSAGDDIDVTGTTTATVSLEDDVTLTAVRATGLGGIGFFDDGGNLGMYIVDGGNVGVGTSSPTFKLEVAGNIGPSANATYDLGSDGNRFRDLYLSGGTLHVGTSSSDEYTIEYDTVNNRLGFNVNGSGNPEISFDSVGQVGIGTTAPASLLSVGPNSQFQVNSAGNIVNIGGVGHSITNNGGNLLLTSAADLQFDDSNLGSPVQLTDTDTSLPNGNIGIIDAINDAYNAATGGAGSLWTSTANVIHPTLATDDLAIGGSTLGASIFSIDESAGTFLFGGDQSANPTLTFEATDNDTGDFGFNTNDAFYFTGASVGVGTSAPQRALDVNGTGRFSNALTLGSVAVDASNNVLVLDAGGVVAQRSVATWDTDASNDVTNFLDLTDTPNSYAGSGTFLVRVNAGATGLEFVDSATIAGVTSVSNSDGTLTISPTTGAVVASLNLGNANIWTADQTFTTDTFFPGSGVWNTSGNVGIGTTAPGQKLTVDGTLGILEGGGTPLFHSIFQGGDQTGDITYTLPVDDGSGDYVLSTDGTGVLSWQSVTGVGAGTGDITAVNAGLGLTGGGTVGDVTLDTGAGDGILVNADDIAINLATTAGVGSTAAFSGLEVDADGLRLLSGCGEAEILMWSDTDNLWQCTSIASAGGITGAGTDNFIPRWNGTDDLENSVIYQTDGGNVGIGTTAPVSLFSVGGASQFQVDASGNIVRLNNVATSFPAAQGAVNSVLRNNGSGVLSWADPTANGTIGYWAKNGPTLFPATLSDNVGIGTTGAQRALDVNGTGRFTGALTLGSVATDASNNVLVLDGAGVVAQRSVATWDTDASDDITNFLDLTDTPNSYAGSGTFIVRVNAGETGLEFVDSSTVGGVNTVSNADGTLTISPTTGNVVASLNLGNANIWTADQTFTTDTFFPGSGIWSAAGDVGIGTTAPAFPLDVVGGVRTSDDFFVGDIGLGFTSPAGASGASLIGTFDEFTNSDSINVQDVLDDLDAAITTGSHPAVTLAGAFDYLTIDVPTQVITLNAIDLSTDVTGLLATVNGGLGADVTAAGAGEILYSTGATAYDSLAAGTAGQFLTSGGAGAPTWSNMAASLTAGDDIDITGTTNATISVEDDIDVTSVAASTGNGLSLTDDGGNLGIFIEDGGDVGIGTTAPIVKLDVAGSFRDSGNTTFGDAAGDTVTSNAGAWTFVNPTTFDLANGSAQSLNIEGGLLNLDTANSRIGIGTTVPQTTLHLVATNPDIRLEETTGTHDIFDTNLTDTGAFIGFTSSLNSDLTFLTNNTARINIDGLTGNVGIGTTAPGSKLSVAGSQTIGAGYAGLAAATNGLLVQGDVGIGNTAPQRTLDVSGTGRYTGQLTLNSTPLILDNNLVLTTNAGVVSTIDTTNWDKTTLDDTTISGTDNRLARFNAAGNNVEDASINDLNPAGVVMTIDAAGNVGVGVTASIYKFEVSGSTNLSTLYLGGVQVFSSAAELNVLDGVVPGLTAAELSFLDGSSDTAGGLIFGDGSGFTQDALNIFWADSSNRLGIGTTVPGSALSVAAGGTFGAGYASFAAPTNGLLVQGVVGIGTTNPLTGSVLDLNGQIRISGGSPGANKVLISDANGLASWTDLGGGGVGVASVTGTANQITAAPTTGNVILSIPSDFRAPGTVNATTGLYTGAGAGTLKLDAAGNLTNIGTMDMIGGITMTGSGAGISFNGAGNHDIVAAAGTLRLGAATLLGALIPGTNDSFDLGSDAGRFNDIYMGATGAFHIGTSTSDEYAINYDTTNNRLGFNVNGTANPEFVFDSAGNLGVGSTNPASMLSVGPTNQFQVDSSGNIVRLNGLTTSFPSVQGAAGSVLSNNGSGTLTWADASTVGFWQRNSGTLAPTTLTDNVGIGVTGARSRLTVAGGATIGAGYSGIGVSAPSNGLLVEGRVGIGTSSPNTSGGGGILEVANTTAGTNDSVTVATLSRRSSGTAANGIGARLEYSIQDSAGALQEASTIDTILTDVTAGSVDSAITFNNRIDSGAFAERMRIAANGNVGIGTTGPQYKLDVLSTTTTGGLQVVADSVTTGTGMNLSFDGLTTGTGLTLASTSTALTTGSLANLDWSPTGSTEIFATGDMFRMNVGQFGNVGNLMALYDNGSPLFRVAQSQIESAVPHLFSAPGDVSIANDLVFTNQTASNIQSYGPLTIASGESFENLNLTLKTYGTGNLVLDTPGGVTLNQPQLWTLPSSTTALNIGNSLMAFNTVNGRIGIGTTVPLTKLHVLETTSAGATAILANTATDGDASLLFLLPGATSWNMGVNDGDGDKFMLGNDGSGSLDTNIRLVVDTSGNVGVGTTTPQSLFEVGDTSTSSTIQNITNRNTGTGAFANLNVRNDNGSQTGMRLITLGTGFTTAGAYVQDGGAVEAGSALAGGLSVMSTNAAGMIRFYTAGTAAVNERMRIDAAGAVGIGVVPAMVGTGRLDVQGDVQINANGAAGVNALCHDGVDSDGSFADRYIIACNPGTLTDYAEYYPTESDVDYGDLVVLGETSVTVNAGDGNGKIDPDAYYTIKKMKKSSIPYDKTVMGVVSKNFGDWTALGQGTIPPEHKPMPIALNGRVPLKVSTTNGTIGEGDSLVSSSISGFAMKATQKGTRVATALDGFDPSAGLGKVVSCPAGTPSGVTCGQIMVFMSIGLYDPDTIASSGTLSDSPDDATNIAFYTGQNLIFDTDDDSDTYLTHDSENDALKVFVDGSEQFRFSPNGNSSNGAIATSMSDLAESYPTQDITLEPGDVVVLDKPVDEATESSESAADISKYMVAKSGGENKDKVLGVISSKPGLVMGGGDFRSQFCSAVDSDEDQAREDMISKEIKSVAEKTVDAEIATASEDGNDISEGRQDMIDDLFETLTDKYTAGKPVLDLGTVAAMEDSISACKSTKQVNVALAGRIPVKYDASNGEIKAGDLLAVSEVKPGSVIKATGTGWVLGRALEDSKAETGMLMMFANLTWYSGETEALSIDTSQPADLSGLSDILKIQDTDTGGKKAVFFSDMNVTGNVTSDSFSTLGQITAGFITINPDDNSISVVGGEDLKLQNGTNPGNIEAFNGALVLKSDGGIVAKADIQADTIVARKVAVLGEATVAEQAISADGSTIGEGSLGSGLLEVTINNSNVTPTSKIFITPTTGTGGKALIVKTKTDGSFTVSIESAHNKEIKFDYWIVEVR